MVVTLRNASAELPPLGASHSRPARLPAPEHDTTSKLTPRSLSPASAPAISAMLGAPPPSTSAVFDLVSARAAFCALLAARLSRWRCRLEWPRGAALGTGVSDVIASPSGQIAP